MATHQFGIPATWAFSGLVLYCVLATAQDTSQPAKTAGERQLATGDPASGVPDFSLLGFATLGGGTTGGKGGSTVNVSNVSEFIAAAASRDPSNIFVSGTIDLGGGTVKPKSNKTIIGMGIDAAIVGSVSLTDASNIILRNLHFSTPPGVSGRDAMNTTRAHHIWIDHCNFGEATDGQLDITHGSDFITISWCKFAYTNAENEHRVSMLIGNRDDTGDEDRGHLKVTLHHNWYGMLVRERMPRIRFGEVHLFNNYYNSAGNNYVIGLGCGAQVLLESSYFDHVKRPWRNSSAAECTQGIIHWNDDNIFAETELPDWTPNSPVFQPPYSYKLDSGKSVKETVMNYAGVGRGPFEPPR